MVDENGMVVLDGWGYKPAARLAITTMTGYKESEKARRVKRSSGNDRLLFYLFDTGSKVVTRALNREFKKGLLCRDLFEIL